MRPKVQQNCVECKRKKIKCSRAQPCANCLKSGAYCFYISRKLNTIEASDKSINVRDMNRYQTLRNLKLEEKWLKLVFKVELIFNWCSEDPRLEHLVSEIPINIYEEITGQSLISKKIANYAKTPLQNPSIQPKLIDLMSNLIGISYKYCLDNPASLETVQHIFETQGFNSFLINCMAACTLPKYLKIKGDFDTSAENNVFYQRALFLLNSNKIGLRDKLLGMIYLISFEAAFKGSWLSSIRSKQFEAMCFEANLNTLDKNQNLQLMEYDLNICEMRNVWYCYLINEIDYSVTNLTPMTVELNPENVYLPHPNFNFTPTKMDPRKILNSVTIEVFTTSPYEIYTNFNSMVRLIWLNQAFTPVLNLYSKYLNTAFGFERMLIVNEILNSIELIEYYYYKFDYKTYELGILNNPSYYATTSQLSTFIIFHHSKVFYHLLLIKFYTELKQLDLAERYRSQGIADANKLLRFVKRTLKIPNYPLPEINLTQLYLNCYWIPTVIAHTSRIYIPVTSISDLENLQYVVELCRFYSYFDEKLKSYVEWCESQISTNGNWSLAQKLKVIEIEMFLDEI